MVRLSLVSYAAWLFTGCSHVLPSVSWVAWMAMQQVTVLTTLKTARHVLHLRSAGLPSMLSELFKKDDSRLPQDLQCLHQYVTSAPARAASGVLLDAVHVASLVTSCCLLASELQQSMGVV